MHYVYVIRSLSTQNQIYVGQTNDLKKRLSNHNSGCSPHTAKYKPWEFVIFFGFKDKDKAIEFEKYLKSGSGRAFANKHFW